MKTLEDDGYFVNVFISCKDPTQDKGLHPIGNIIDEPYRAEDWEHRHGGSLIVTAFITRSVDFL